MADIHLNYGLLRENIQMSVFTGFPLFQIAILREAQSLEVPKIKSFRKKVINKSYELLVHIKNIQFNVKMKNPDEEFYLFSEFFQHILPSLHYPEMAH